MWRINKMNLEAQKFSCVNNKFANKINIEDKSWDCFLQKKRKIEKFWELQIYKINHLDNENKNENCSKISMRKIKN